MTGTPRQPELLALTLHPPWGYAITWWLKNLENRGWHPESYGLKPGDIFCIHSGKLNPPKEKARIKGGAEWFALTQTLVSLADAGLLPGGHDALNQDLAMALENASSAIVAVVTLDRVVEKGSDDPANRSPWRADDEFAWVLRDPVPIVPIPCKGAQKLWQVPDRLRTMVRDRCRECPSCHAVMWEVLQLGHRAECELEVENGRWKARAA